MSSKHASRTLLGKLWSHASAAVALALILGALVVGYRLGRPAPDPGDASDSGVHAEGAGNEGIGESGEPTLYTCSMHPSVRLPDPDAKCPICFMDLIPVASGDGEGGENRITLSAAGTALSRIETAAVARFFPTAEVRLFGKVTYDETSVARLTAYFPGRIDRLFVNFVGIPVAEGDHIAEVYSPELLAAFEELRQASRADADASAMSEIVRSATRGTLRAARDKLRLFGVAPEQIEASERGESATDRLTVYAPIGGVVTHLAVRAGDYIEEGTPIATVADLSRLWLDLEAYESQLAMLRWGQRVTFGVEAYPGEVFEGRVAFIEPVVDERTRAAAVRVAVENPQGRLKPGMFASAVIRSRLSEGGAVVGDELAGRWVSPMHPTVVKDGPGVCDVCGMDLVPAESLGIVGDPASAREPLVIPRSAVLFTGTRSVVYVEDPEAESPTFEARDVVIGPRAGEFFVVREGLGEGERVVVQGAFRIDSAMQIAAKPSMMSHAHGGEAAIGSGSPGTPGGTHAEVPDAFLFGLKPVYAAYLDAQEALAADDVAGFARAAEDLRTAVGFVEEAGLLGEPLAAWRRAALGLRVEGAIENIDTARERFESMSAAALSLQGNFGHLGSETWHEAYCPMAFDNAGASWLQRGTRINNPYFGDAMLRCGEIRADFRPRNRADDGDHQSHEGHRHE